MKHGTHKHAASAAKGFTLIEIVLTIVILGTVAGLMVPFFNAIVRSPDPAIRERAISLGQAMMDEIMAKRWDENTPIGGGPLNTVESTRGSTAPAASLGPDGEARIDFDDVDDYNGINEVNNFTDQNGAAFVLTGYSRQVAVRYIASNTNPIDQNTPAAAGTTDTKLVVVRITSPLGEVFNFVAVACNI